MVTIKINQITTDMLEGKINYYYEVQGDNVIRDFSSVGYFDISFKFWEKTADELNHPDEIKVDAQVVKKAFGSTYEFFRIIIDGQDVTPDRTPLNLAIREELENESYSLEELFEMYDEQENIYQKTTGFLRLTAKYKKMVINEIIGKVFEDMEADYKKYI